MSQIIVNIIIQSSLYYLISFSFSIIYSTTKFFNIAHATIITIAAYFSYLFYNQIHIPLILVIPIAIIISSSIGLSLFKFVLKPLKNLDTDSFYLLIASLGLYIIIQNIISIVWGDSTLSLRSEVIKIGYPFFGAYITLIQIVTIASCIVIFILNIFIYKFTKLGRHILAISSNHHLANIFGVNSNTIIFWSFIIGSGVASVVGILVAFDVDLRPNMGFNLLLYGVVAMIIGGIGSNYSLLFGAILLSFAQHIGAYYTDSTWMDAIAYFILIIFLIWKPLGFSGRQLKKTEI